MCFLPPLNSTAHFNHIRKWVLQKKIIALRRKKNKPLKALFTKHLYPYNPQPTRKKSFFLPLGFVLLIKAPIFASQLGKTSAHLALKMLIQ